MALTAKMIMTTRHQISYSSENKDVKATRKENDPKNLSDVDKHVLLL